MALTYVSSHSFSSLLPWPFLHSPPRCHGNPSCSVLVHFPFSLPSGSHPASWLKHQWCIDGIWLISLAQISFLTSRLMWPAVLAVSTWRHNLSAFQLNISKPKLLIFPRICFSHNVPHSGNNSSILSVAQVKNLQVLTLLYNYNLYQVLSALLSNISRIRPAPTTSTTAPSSLTWVTAIAS